MANNFWQSSHWRHLVPRARLLEAHADDREAGLTDDAIQCIKIHVLHYLSDVAKISQQLIRQRVVGTAMTYLRRAYVAHNFKEYDPRALGPACLYLACKAEEAQVQAKVLFQIMRKLEARWPGWPVLEMQQLLDLEMALLEILDFSLIVYSPYRDLVAFLADPCIAGLAEPAWHAPSPWGPGSAHRQPPCLIAAAAVCMAAAAAKQDIEPWLRSLELDYAQLADATAELTFSYQHFQEGLSAAEFERCLALTSHTRQAT